MIVGLILLHTGICLHTALTKNVTHDELWHLPVGLLHLQSGDFDQDVLNPPLSRMWAALPLWVSGVTTERGPDGSACGVNFVNGHDDFQKWYNRGRMAHLVWTIATACLVARWARELFGPAAAVLATLLYCTCPNVIAHASIVTPDVPLMCLWVATLYAAWRWAKSESWSAAAIVGLLLGLAQATKFTAILLYPILLCVWLACFLRAPSRSSPDKATYRSRRTLLVQPVASILLSLAVLCASYGFSGVGTPLRAFQFQSGAMQTIAILLSPLDGLPVPAPADWISGIDAQRFVMEQPHPVYLDGMWNVTGFRGYYVMTLLYKLPHSLQALSALSAGCLLLGLCRRRWGIQALLLFPSALLIGVASLSGMQLGVRYVLPALPLIMLFAAQIAIPIEARSVRVRRAAWCVIAAGCLWSLRHHPHHLAYFNEAAGGPVGGRAHLLDSNLDWGQDLYLVKAFLEEEGLEAINLAYFGTLWPERLGIHSTVPSGAALTPGWYAVSVNFVMGRSHRVHDPANPNRAVQFDEFAILREMEPVTTLGGSIDVYRITEDERRLNTSTVEGSGTPD